MTDGNNVPADGGDERGSIGDAIRCMVSFFTIIRLDVGQKEFDAMERNFWAAPFIGLLNGLVAALVCFLLILVNASPILQGIAALATVFIFSKFLHFDGLTDFGDGMVVSSDKREDHVRALKDSLIGAGGFGVALIVTLISFACYSNIAAYWGSIVGAVIVAEILAKNSQVAAAAFGQPGNGMASRQVGLTDTGSLIKSTILTIVLLALTIVIHWTFCNCFDYAIDLSVMVAAIVLGLAISILVGWGMARISNGTFGFVNGDILGATNEISRAIGLVFAVACMGLWF